MGFNSWLHFKKNKYTQLLVVLICIFIVGSIIDSWQGSILLSFCFLGSSIAILETFDLPKKLMYLLKIIALIGFACNIIDLLNLSLFGHYISIFGYFVYSLFMILAILIIQKRINSAEKVDDDIVRGGICIYLILGILWYIFYLIVWNLDPAAFKGLEASQATQKIFYFSFTTLTTLGYGDITPVNRLAMTLTNLEAIVGQLYPAIVIAKLVSLYISR